MRILHLLSTNSFSGAENVVCQIIDMYKDNEDIDMIYCSPKGSIEEKLSEKNITFLPLKNLKYKEIKDAINSYNSNIIHAHDVKASIYASLFSKKCRIISHIHGNSIAMRKISLKSLLFLFASKNFSHIFWVSGSSLKDYKFYNKIYKKSSVLVNVVNKEEILKKSNEIKIKQKFDVIYVGRLTELKDPLRLVNIFSSVVKKIPNSKLAIIGNGNMYDEVDNFIKNNKLEKNIYLLGFQTNPYGYIKKSKIMMLTSIYEGTPMCALEAMCLGKPIISTPTDGMIDLIKQDINGFLSNNDSELLEKIIELLKNEDKLLKMSENAEKLSAKINDINKYKKILNNYYK